MINTQRLLELIRTAPAPPDPSTVSGHARAEARSLARHRQVAIKLVEDHGLLERHVLPIIARFKEIHAGTSVIRDFDKWERAVLSGVEAVVRICIDSGEDGKRLRQNTPLVGILTEAERMKIHNAFTH